MWINWKHAILESILAEFIPSHVNNSNVPLISALRVLDIVTKDQKITTPATFYIHPQLNN